MESQAERQQQNETSFAWGPIGENRPAKNESSQLKVVAFNSRGGSFLGEIVDRLRRPPLSDPDVILLCEADWGLKRSNRCEMAAELAAAMRMSFAFVGEFGIWRPEGLQPNAFMGNAILSSRPLADIDALALPRGFLRRRVRYLGAPAGLIAKIVVNGKPITLGVAHLNSRWNPDGRDQQMREFMGALPRDGAAIIGGDFNTTTIDLRTPSLMMKAAPLFLLTPWRFRRPQPWEPLFERLGKAGFETRGANAPGRATFTFSRAIPPWVRPKLDWIALRRLKPEPRSAAVVPARNGMLSRRFSDHDFVTCVVRV